MTGHCCGVAHWWVYSAARAEKMYLNVHSCKDWAGPAACLACVPRGQLCCCEDTLTVSSFLCFQDTLRTEPLASHPCLHQTPPKTCIWQSATLTTHSCFFKSLYSSGSLPHSSGSSRWRTSPPDQKIIPTPHLCSECFLNSESWLFHVVQMNHNFMSGLEFCTKIQAYKYQCVSCIFI